MNNFRIQVTGKVQGVGFRPFVFRLAKKHHLKGRVWNEGGEVLIQIQSTQKQLEDFVEAVQKQKPSSSVIKAIRIKQDSKVDFHDFFILHSKRNTPKHLYFPTDLATCPSCLNELEQVGNRRHEYPFITCSNCGPRFSIIKELPFNRQNTSMGDLSICPHCENEVASPDDRRFHSQTNSCAHCGVQMKLLNKHREAIDLRQSEMIPKVAELLLQGFLVGVKGIGGYLIMCDAFNEKTLRTLRVRKNRRNKPLAIMLPSIEACKAYFHVSKKEEGWLCSPEAPITLLKPINQNTFPDSLICGLDRIGVILPYSPIFNMIFSYHQKPLVALSGNLSNSPIIYQDNLAVKHLLNYTDFLLTHNREIINPVDDSILQVSNQNQTIFHRRARGFAPNVTFSPQVSKADRVISFGADLNSSFTISTESDVFVSQYLGNQKDLLSQYNFEDSLDNYINLLQAKPEKVIVDLNPNYFSSKNGAKFAEEYKIPAFSIQHQKAHFAAVLAENHLLSKKEKILGFIWDGEGYGEDGNIWGSEVFAFNGKSFERLFHLKPFANVAGERFAERAALPALSIFNDYFPKSFWKRYIKDWEYNAFISFALNKRNPKTTSMARLFDAIGFFTNSKVENTFDDEVAMHMEKEANKWLSTQENLNDVIGYKLNVSNGEFLLEDLSEELKQDIENEISKSQIAAKFLAGLANLVISTSLLTGFNYIALSGSVFQNSTLVDLILSRAKINGIKVFTHQHLAPNDENISFGQWAYFNFFGSDQLKKVKNANSNKSTKG